MKHFFALATLFISINSFACGDLPTKVDNGYIYGEVISMSHMDLELALVLKDDRHAQVKVFGGYDYDESSLPACDSKEEQAPLTWYNGRMMASHSTSGGSSSFSAAYKICIFSFRGGLLREYSICNSEVGD